MIWAVLVGDGSLARLFWSRTQEPIRAALVASQLCQHLAGMAHLSAEQTHLQEQASACEEVGSEHRKWDLNTGSGI